MSDKITDKELIMLIQEHTNGKELDDELIFRAAIELKTYRDLERHGRIKKEKRCIEHGEDYDGLSVAEIIEKAKSDFCNNFCKKTAECDESGWTIKCPLDVL